jgi:hypothetical protein
MNVMQLKTCSPHILNLCIHEFHVIVSGKTAFFEQKPSVGDFAILHPVFTSSDFATTLFTEQGQHCD